MTLAARKFFDTPPDLLTAQMEQEFFTSIMGKNKTYKTTYHDRFSEIDQLLARQVRAGTMRASHVLDVGVSSGISTLELFTALSADGNDVNMVATDVLIDADIVGVAPGCHALIDKSGFPLMFDVFGMGVKPWITAADYKNGAFVLRKLTNVLFTSIARRVLDHPNDDRVKHVQLITPRLSAQRKISVCHDDIAQYNARFAGRFDLIRAANILNKNYFENDTLIAMIGNLKRYLTGDGGCLLVVRTRENSTNHGTLFRMGGNGSFEAATRFGDGSEIEDIVLRSQSAAACSRDDC